jgi:hypothetical protein
MHKAIMDNNITKPIFFSEDEIRRQHGCLAQVQYLHIFRDIQGAEGFFVVSVPFAFSPAKHIPTVIRGLAIMEPAV